MYKILYLYERVVTLVNDPDCDIFGDDYDKIVWRDQRPKPSKEALKALDIDLILAKKNKINDLMKYYKKKEAFFLKMFTEIDNVQFYTYFANNTLVKAKIYEGTIWPDCYLKNDAEDYQKVSLQIPEGTTATYQKKESVNWAAKTFHKKAIKGLGTITEVNNYDYTTVINGVKINNDTFLVDITSWLV